MSSLAAIDTYNDTSKLVRAYQNLYFNGTNDKYNVGAGKIVADSTVIYIDENGYVVEDATPSAAEELSGGNGYYANAFMVVNADNEIDLLVYESNNRIKDGSNKEVTLTKTTTKDGITLSPSMNNATVKDLDDGVYIPADKSFVTNPGDVAGEAKDNLIFKFTTSDSTKTYKLTITGSDGQEKYSEEFASPADGGHFFYVTTKAGTVSSQNAGDGTYKTQDFAAGVHTYTITVDSTVVSSGNFVI